MSRIEPQSSSANDGVGPGVGPTLRDGLGLSLAAGVAVGWLDVILSLGVSGQGMATLGVAAWCLAATSWAALAFLLVATLASRVSARMNRPKAAGAILERAVVLTTLAPALLALRDTVRGALITGWTLSAALLLTASLAIPILASRWAGRWNSCGPGKDRDVLLVRTVIGLAATAVVLWIVRIERDAAWIAGVVVIVALALAMCISAGRLARSASAQRRMRIAWVSACSMPLLSPAISLLPRPLAPASVVAADATASAYPPIVILLTVDTLRWDALGFNQATLAESAVPAGEGDGSSAHGATDEPPSSSHASMGARQSPTPRLDDLAGRGVVYTQARASAPWTLPSFVSIHTGLSPDVHGATRPESRAPSGVDTLASRLRAAGYATAAFGANPFLRPQANLCHGFDTYEFYPRPSASLLGGKLLERVRPRAFRADATTSDLTDLALSWLESNARRPQFLWLHYFDPHAPYDPPRDLAPPRPDGVTLDPALEYADGFRAGRFIPTLAERQYLHKLYNAEVQYVDREVGRLLDGLRRMNLFDRSLIVFTSDHGEELWDHEGFEHGHSVYDELIHVPLVVKQPAGAGTTRVASVSSEHAPAQSAMRCDAPVSLEQIVPTVLTCCGAAAGDHPEWRPPLLGLLKADAHATEAQNGMGEGGSEGANEAACASVSSGLLYYENRHAIVFDHYKYVVSDTGGREALFDLQGDPGERCSLIFAQPEWASRGRDLLRDHMNVATSIRRRLHLSDERVAIDVDTQRRLRSLGYID